MSHTHTLLSQVSTAGTLSVECTSSPTVLASCSHSNPRATTLVLQNTLDKPLLVEWLDPRGAAVPRYFLPADCAVWLPTTLSSSWRVRAGLVKGGARLAGCRYPLSSPIRPTGVLLPQLAEAVNTSGPVRGFGGAAAGQGGVWGGGPWLPLGVGPHPEIVFEVQVLTAKQKAHLASFAFNRGHESMCAELASVDVAAVGSGAVSFEPGDEVEVALLADTHPLCAPSAGHWLPPNRPPYKQWALHGVPPSRPIYGPHVPVGPPPEEGHGPLFVGGGPPEAGPHYLPPIALELAQQEVRFRVAHKRRRGHRSAGGAAAPPVGVEEETGEEGGYLDEAFEDFLKALDEEQGGGKDSTKGTGRVKRRESATLSLSFRKVVGSAPVDPYEGVVLTATTTLADLAQPRSIVAAFNRPCPCPACNYRLRAVNDSEVKGPGGGGGGDADGTAPPPPELSAQERAEQQCASLIPHTRVEIETCHACGGDGIVTISHDIPPASVSAVGYSHLHSTTGTHCPVCGGVGTLASHGHACSTCGGRRYVRHPYTHADVVPAGAADTWKAVQPGAGGIVPFRTAGDIHAHLHVVPQPSDPRKKEAVTAETSELSAAFTGGAGSLFGVGQRLSNYSRLGLFPGWGAEGWASSPQNTSLPTASLSPAMAVLAAVALDTSSPTLVGAAGPHVAAAVSISLPTAVTGFRVRLRPPLTKIQSLPRSELEGEEEQQWRRAMEEAAEKRARETLYASGMWRSSGSGLGDVLDVGEVEGETETLEGETGRGDERVPDEEIDLDVEGDAAGGVAARPAGGGVGRESVDSTPPPSPPIPLRLIDEDFGALPWVVDLRGTAVLPGDLIVLPGAGLPVHLPGTCAWTVPCTTPDKHNCGVPRETIAANCSDLASAWAESFAAYLRACESLPASTSRSKGLYAGGSSFLPWTPLASVPLADLHRELVARVPPPQRLGEEEGGNGTQAEGEAGGSTEGAQGGTAGQSGPSAASSSAPVGTVHVMCPGRQSAGGPLLGGAQPLLWPPPASPIRFFPHGSAVLVPQVDTGLGLSFETGSGAGGDGQAADKDAYRPVYGEDLLPDRHSLTALRSLVRSAVSLMAPNLKHGGAA